MLFAPSIASITPRRDDAELLRGIDVRRLPRLQRLGGKRDEASLDRCFLDNVSFAAHPQLEDPPFPDGHNDDAAGENLLQPFSRRPDPRGSPRYESIVRCSRRIAFAPVADQHLHVVQPVSA
jgi:hypothetical protein